MSLIFFAIPSVGNKREHDFRGEFCSKVLPDAEKTLLARAVAGEASAKFFLVSASEFVEMFVGVGAARVRDMFEQAIKEAPAIVFIDELDAVGRRRGSGIGAANDEREQTLNQLLVSMDGFETNDQVVVLAATNRADILDKALVRPGRFDRRLIIPFPSHEDRIGILEIHCEPIPLSTRRLAGLPGPDHRRIERCSVGKPCQRGSHARGS